MTRPRMLTMADVADILNTSESQVYALVRSKSLRAMKMGGRGQWRIDPAALDEYIDKTHAETSAWIDDHPFTGSDGE